MSENSNPDRLPVAVIVGATSKWQSNGRNTRFIHGHDIDEAGIPAMTRWGLGGALAQKFARSGHFVVLTSRNPENTRDLADAIAEAGGRCMSVRLDVGSPESVSGAFAAIREQAGDVDVLIYNAGYMAGRELPPEQELLEHFPNDLFDVALATACKGPFLVVKQVLPAMRERGHGSVFFSNNQYSLRGRRRATGESLYYPRTMMRALAQALTEEYSPFGVHVANVVVDGFIDSPGTRALGQFAEHPERLIDPGAIAEAFHYLHRQDRSCWTHELQLTASATTPSH
ncbi:SDR family oxidoreductase [Amycolatopsis sp. K13G38]|uniref:SDR family oxidoreductase n=1 Tax=Amycolatopsis acididurans TaxID=2724524 RepID=A0ABX1J7A6_9PSEU|nr:SDR family oxidoreductase [Amycolatopsis acididurans]NKQ55544.1 SDR family oxidoreductase [Amycolatopsis acididurans]